jgi:hypothetical protein
VQIPPNAIIPEAKLTRYLLIFRPYDDKSKFLAKAGFTLKNPDDLMLALRQVIQGDFSIRKYRIFFSP